MRRRRIDDDCLGDRCTRPNCGTKNPEPDAHCQPLVCDHRHQLPPPEFLFGKWKNCTTADMTEVEKVVAELLTRVEAREAVRDHDGGPLIAHFAHRLGGSRNSSVRLRRLRCSS